MSKIYTGTWSNDGLGGQSVTVTENGTTYDLPHHVRHSPDGFNWGFGGSGPAELARCLLIDVFGFSASEVAAYQDFKWKVIAQLPEDRWTMTDQTIREWAEGWMGK